MCVNKNVPDYQASPCNPLLRSLPSVARHKRDFKLLYVGLWLAKAKLYIETNENTANQTYDWPSLVSSRFVTT